MVRISLGEWILVRLIVLLLMACSAIDRNLHSVSTPLEQGSP
jgi:Sec-independent protein translocase protein TatA